MNPADLWSKIPPLIQYIIIFLAVSGVGGGIAAYLTYVERKIIAAIQSRKGPNVVGKFGLLQPIADLIKLLGKEDILPLQADAPLFRFAPYLVFLSAVLSLVIVPFGKNMIAGDLHIGVVYFMAVSSLVVIGIFFAGWSSNNKYSLYGAMRSIAQLVSYEIPMGFALLGIVVLTSSAKISDIIQYQAQGMIWLPQTEWWVFPPRWLIFPQFLGFLVFLIASIAECNRTPFDLPEAESELVAGYSTEYSGIRFGMFFAAEYLVMFINSALISTFYLGGWLPPWKVDEPEKISLLASFFWLYLKVGACIFLFIWVRATLPRFRVDQLMGFAWKVLIPLSIVNLFIAGGEALIWLPL
ncbi:MAG: NADH-quinone oxidoreductase subunit NuoH [bacterium JZ-2024 1]